MGEEKQHSYISTLVRDGATPFARPPRGDAAFGSSERFRQPFSAFSKLQTEAESAPELSAENITDISPEIVLGSSRESSSHEPGASCAPISALPVRPEAPAFHSIEDGGAESEIVSLSPTLEGHHEPSSRHANAHHTQPPTGASYITSVTTDEGDKVPAQRLAMRVRENSPASLSASETANGRDGSEISAVYRRAQDEGVAQAGESHQSRTPALVSRSDVPHGDDEHNFAARETTLSLSPSLIQEETQTVAEKISHDKEGDDRSDREQSAARRGEQPISAAEKYDANPDAARPEEVLTISPPSSRTSHKVFTHDLRHLFRGESRIAPDGDLHAQKQTSLEGADVTASLPRLSRAAKSTEANPEQERQSETKGRASSTARATVSGKLAAKASQATRAPTSEHSMRDVRRESENQTKLVNETELESLNGQTKREGQTGRGLATPRANVKAVRGRIEAAFRPSSEEEGKSSDRQSASGEPSPAVASRAFAASEKSGVDGGAYGGSELAVAVAKNESRELNESLSSLSDTAFGRRAMPEQDASLRDAGAFSLKVNRLDVKLVNQVPKSPPAPPTGTPPAQPKSEEYLERYYLGRFYLNL